MNSDLERLSKLLSYEPSTGLFRWKKKMGCRSSGAVAGTRQAVKPNIHYIVISVHGNRYLAHRLAWLFKTGRWPKSGTVIDHINRNPEDNRWGNLREATHAQNQWNRAKSKTNTSGFKNVRFDKRHSRYNAGCMINGKFFHVGSYRTALEASSAYKKFEAAHHGEFACRT